MSAPSRPTDITGLLCHDGWLRGLVRGLVADADSCDEVVQKTWLAALRKPPADRRNLRGWLSRVARNAALRERRSEARRRRHERAAAERSSAPDGERIELDLELRQRLLQAVRELREPYRETIWRRYLERCSTVEIAAAQGVTTSTVRSRLQRGLTELRVVLGQRDGDRRGLLPLGLALLGGLPGGVLMGTGTKLLTAAAAVVLAIFGYVMAGRPAATVPAVAAGDVGGEVANVAADPGGLHVSGLEREPIESELEGVGAAEPSEVVRGRVLDPAGAPLPDVPVGWSGSAGVLVRSSADGRFELPLPTGLGGAAVIAAAGEGWATLRGWALRERSERASIVVVPSVPLRGRVVDDAGQAIAGVDVEVSVNELSSFPTSLERHRGFAALRVQSAADGSFAFDAVPDARDAVLAAARVGFQVEFGEVPVGGATQLELVLKREWQDRLHGIVVDASGAPISGAQVDWGLASERSDASGRFTCAWPPPRVGAMTMVVVAPGHQSFVRQYGREAWQREGRPDPLRVQLGVPPLRIAGTVRHADGAAASGMRIAVLDTTMLYSRSPQTSAEQIAAGLTDVRPIEAATVDAHGNFEVRGLSAKEYRLVAWHPGTLLAIRTGPFAAGSRGVEILLPADAMRRSLRGRVVSRAGRPLAGVTVSTVLQMLPGPEGQARSERTTVSAADGSFELTDVPRRGRCMIGLTGEPVVGIYHEVEAFADREFVELVADARCRVRFLAGSPAVDAKYLVFVDGAGKHVPMWSMTDGGMTPKNFLELDGAGSAEFAVSERAHAIAYYRGGKVVHRREVQLVPDQLNKLAP